MSDEITNTEEVEEIVEEVVSEKPKAKSKAKRRSVRSVMRSVFHDAPGDLLDLMERQLGVSTLADLQELDGSAERQIDTAFNRYVNRVGSGTLDMPHGFEDKLKEYAEKHNIDYDSMLSGRGLGALDGAIRSVIGYNGSQAIVDEAK